MKALIRFLLLAPLFVLATDAFAAARTFVASTGLDTNPCSLVAPCRSFAQALTVTDASGEIIVVDSAGYGRVTINKSVSIIAAPGVYAGVSVFAATDGIDINTPGVSVVLRGLTINGQGGSIGIDFGQGTELHVENCVISNMASLGIRALAAGSRVFIKDTIVRDTGNNGIVFVNAVEAHLDRVRSERNGATGLALVDGPQVSVSNSELVDNAIDGLTVTTLSPSAVTRAAVESSNLSGNAVFGIRDISSVGTTEVSVTRSTLSGNGNSGAACSAAAVGATVTLTATDNLISGNGNIGISVAGSGATIHASGNTITRNTSLGLSNSGAVLLSRANNTVSANNSGGAQTLGVITTLGGL
jgi:parallel beta helix pectate lyase-like protein